MKLPQLPAAQGYTKNKDDAHGFLAAQNGTQAIAMFLVNWPGILAWRACLRARDLEGSADTSDPYQPYHLII